MKRLGVALLSALMMVITALIAWRTYADPLALPHGDAGAYTVQAFRFRELLRAGDLQGLFSLSSLPLLHPPLHALGLGAWTALFGQSQVAVRLWGGFAGIVGLGATVWLAEKVAPRRGWLVGLGAAGVTAAGPLHMQMLFTPMTEQLALVLSTGALIAAVAELGQAGDSERNLAPLWTGLAIAAAGLVRYNYWLMLPAALGAFLMWERARGDAPELDRLGGWRVWLWLAPSAAVIALWQLVDGRFLGQLKVFLENRNAASGAHAWSADNLMWLPRTLFDFGIHGPGLSPLLFGMMIAGLIPAILGRDLVFEREIGGRPLRLELVTARRLRILQCAVLVGLAAVSLHPYKLIRNLHALLPLSLLVALLPVSGSRWGLVPAGAVIYGLAMLRVLFQLATVPGFAEESTYYRDDAMRQTLGQLGELAAGSEDLVIFGWASPLEWHLPEVWLRDQGVRTRVSVLWMPEVGLDPKLEALYLTPPGQTVTAADMLTEEAAKTSTYLVVELNRGDESPPTAAEVNANAALAQARLWELRVPEVERLNLWEAGLIIHVFRKHGG